MTAEEVEAEQRQVVLLTSAYPVITMTQPLRSGAEGWARVEEEVMAGPND